MKFRTFQFKQENLKLNIFRKKLRKRKKNKKIV